MVYAGEDWIKMPGVNPTFWLNYLFFTNPYHWNGTVRTTSHHIGLTFGDDSVYHSSPLHLSLCFHQWYFSVRPMTCVVRYCY